MKRTLLHGMSSHAYNELIRLNSFENVLDTTWNCSNGSYLYAYDVDDFIKGEDCEKDLVINRCFESAAIGSAKFNQIDNKLYVVELEIDADEVDILEDTSCENMSYAFEIDRDEITTANIVNVYVSEDYESSLKLFYLSGLLKNEYFDIDLSDKEIRAIENIGYFEELFDFEFKTIDFNNL